MSKTEDVRVRYGRRESRTPKNTLVTFRNGNTVYFGISRCNVEAGDTFLKSLGKHIAKQRADMASVNPDESKDLVPGTSVKVHESGLRGRVDIGHIKELLKTFDNIDDVLYRKALNDRLNQTEHVGVE